jgi:hypothetical protein
MDIGYSLLDIPASFPSSPYTFYMSYMVNGFFFLLSLSPTDHRLPITDYRSPPPSSPPRLARASILKLCLSAGINSQAMLERGHQFSSYA